MVDRVTAFDGSSIEAQVYVDPAWTLFHGHFPERPILPGVILVEMIAQAGALIGCIEQLMEPGKFLAFSGIEKARFRRPVLPGETVDLFATLESERRGFYRFSGSASVDGAVAAKVQFSAAQMGFE
jgi:3-hydroxyacyl-[acyl-carrier-protein] dehydratase